MTRIQNPTSILCMALLSTILVLAYVDMENGPLEDHAVLYVQLMIRILHHAMPSTPPYFLGLW